MQSNEAVRKEDKVHLCAFSIVLLLGIVVRLAFLFQPMRYDEAFSLTNYASKPLSLGLSSYSYPNNHLFHTFLVHLAYSVFGNRPWVIRLPALSAGILLIPASYLVTRLFHNKHAALLSAGVVASSSVLVEYSTNARGYTLVCLIFLLTLALGIVLTKQTNHWACLLFGVISAIGFYTIPIMLYPFGIVVNWLFFSIIYEKSEASRRFLFRQLWIALCITIVLTFILYLPVFLSFGFNSVFANRFVMPKSWGDFIVQFPPSLLSVWNQWNRDLPLAISVVFVIGFFVSLIFHHRMSRYRVPVVVAVVAWVGPILAFQRVVPFERVWLFLFPLYIGLASSGIVHFLSFMPSKEAANSAMFCFLSLGLSLWLGVNVLCSGSIQESSETGTLRDGEKITLFLKDYLKPGDRVLVSVPSDSILIYYFDLHGVSRNYLRSDLDSSDRILIIVNESNHQTLKGFLQWPESLKTDLTPPIVIRRYESATLYEIRRMTRD